MNILILDEQQKVLYGHQLLERIVHTGNSNEVEVVSVPIDPYIAYVSVRFPDNRDVQALMSEVWDELNVHSPSKAPEVASPTPEKPRLSPLALKIAREEHRSRSEEHYSSPPSHERSQDIEIER